MGLRVKVIKTEVVTPKQFCHEHLLPLTNLDFVVPPIDFGAFYCFKKPNNHVDVTTMFSVLKTSLSETLSLFYPLAGEIVSNEAGEPEIHCNNKGVDFIEAVADVELRELEFYNHDENIGGKLMPNKHHGVLAIQVTMLKCGAMVIGCLYDHRVADGYSTNLFVTAWGNITRCEPPSILPYFFPINARQPTHYTDSVANMFIPLSNLPSPESDPKIGSDLDLESLTNRIYYIKGDQIKNLQLLSSQNGHRRSKIESFTSFLWKSAASFLEDSGHTGYLCNIAVSVDGRMRLSEGEGVEKQKLMAGRLGNIVSIPFKGIQSKDLKDMPLSSVANEVHDLFKNASTKEHFKELIDWVEDQRPNVLISRPFAQKEKVLSIMVSSGRNFSLVDKLDFGWGKPMLISSHVPATRTDCHVMLMASPINREDWIVFMHLSKKHLDYMEAHASHVFKPLTPHYLKLAYKSRI